MTVSSLFTQILQTLFTELGIKMTNSVCQIGFIKVIQRLANFPKIVYGVDEIQINEKWINEFEEQKALEEE